MLICELSDVFRKLGERHGFAVVDFHPNLELANWRKRTSEPPDKRLQVCRLLAILRPVTTQSEYTHSCSRFAVLVDANPVGLQGDVTDLPFRGIERAPVKFYFVCRWLAVGPCGHPGTMTQAHHREPADSLISQVLVRPIWFGRAESVIGTDG
ncbi:hypothetical protein D3C85_810000 [compost metagenome]